jgi:acetyl-CoA acetyltransferase family protein
MASLLAGIPNSVAAVTFNRLCASGLNAVNQAARAIAAGEGDVYLAGGVEQMTRAPFTMPKQERAFGNGNVTIYDTTLGWRYPNPKMEAMFPLESMGETAENIYEQNTHLTREKQDEFALESQRRAINAINEGRFREQIVPVMIPQRKGDPICFDTDEHPRYRIENSRAVLDTSLEQLGKLNPAFRKGGTVTAGNSSGLNDGAAAVLLMSRDKAEELGMKPLARWVASAAAGVDPRTMGLGPVPATAKALMRAGLTIEDIDLIELNEAFAVQSLAVMEQAGFRPEITNVNGGAIAIGHPLGASGARLVATLLHEMRRRKAAGEAMRYGLTTLCVGVGQGESAVFEIL